MDENKNEEMNSIETEEEIANVNDEEIVDVNEEILEVEEESFEIDNEETISIKEDNKKKTAEDKTEPENKPVPYATFDKKTIIIIVIVLIILYGLYAYFTYFQ